MRASLNDVLFRSLLILVAAAPLPLGANRPWAWSFLALAIALLLGAGGATGWLFGKRPGLKIPILLPVVLCYVGVLAWGLLQASAWIPSVWVPNAWVPNAWVPNAWVPSAWRHPLWADSALALRRPQPGSISLDPALTRAAVMKLASYGGIFWLAATLGRRRSRANLGITVLTWAECIYALYGLLVYFGGWERVLWFPKWAYPDDLTASFVGRNAYGAYAGLGVVVCLTLAAASVAALGGGLRYRLEQGVRRGVPPLLGGLGLATALLLSHSRGGLIATGVAIAVLLVALWVGRVLRWRLFLASTILLGLSGAALLLTSGQVTVERLLDQNEWAGDRGQLLRIEGRMADDASWMGMGLGAFAPAFRLYRDPSLPRPVIYDYAHNIYLETIIELGWPVAILEVVGFSLILWQCATGLRRRRRDQIFPALALAAAALFLVQGIADFAIEIPANAATLAFLLGLGVAQSVSSRDLSKGDCESTSTRIKNELAPV